MLIISIIFEPLGTPVPTTDIPTDIRSVLDIVTVSLLLTKSQVSVNSLAVENNTFTF